MNVQAVNLTLVGILFVTNCLISWTFLNIINCVLNPNHIRYVLILQCLRSVKVCLIIKKFISQFNFVLFKRQGFFLKMHTYVSDILITWWNLELKLQILHFLGHEVFVPIKDFLLVQPQVLRFWRNKPYRIEQYGKHYANRDQCAYSVKLSNKCLICLKVSLTLLNRKLIRMIEVFEEYIFPKLVFSLYP